MTFNPALDYVVRMEHFFLGQVNRTRSEEIQFGGKGINVSTVLKNLGVKAARSALSRALPAGRWRTGCVRWGWTPTLSTWKAA